MPTENVIAVAETSYSQNCSRDELIADIRYFQGLGQPVPHSMIDALIQSTEDTENQELISNLEGNLLEQRERNESLEKALLASKSAQIKYTQDFATGAGARISSIHSIVKGSMHEIQNYQKTILGDKRNRSSIQKSIDSANKIDLLGQKISASWSGTELYKNLKETLDYLDQADAAARVAHMRQMQSLLSYIATSSMGRAGSLENMLLTLKNLGGAYTKEQDLELYTMMVNEIRDIEKALNKAVHNK